MESYKFSRRRHKPLPATDWERFNADWRAVVPYREWRGSLHATLAAAASALECPGQRSREAWATRGWVTPETLLCGWIQARHWEVLSYPAEDLLVVRRKEKPLRVEGPQQPGLFDLVEESGMDY